MNLLSCDCGQTLLFNGLEDCLEWERLSGRISREKERGDVGDVAVEEHRGEEGNVWWGTMVRSVGWGKE